MEPFVRDAKRKACENDITFSILHESSECWLLVFGDRDWEGSDSIQWMLGENLLENEPSPDALVHAVRESLDCDFLDYGFLNPKLFQLVG